MLHPRFSDAFIIFKCFIVMHLIRMPLIILLPLKNCQEALKKKIECRVHVRGTLRSYLMDADVLLLRLDHPDPLFPHFVHDTEDVYHIKFPDSL